MLFFKIFFFLTSEIPKTLAYICVSNFQGKGKEFINKTTYISTTTINST